MSTESSIHISDLHRGININPEREDLFRDKFLASLKAIGVKPSQFGAGRLHEVIKSTFEAIQNVYDHADRKPRIKGEGLDAGPITSCFALSLVGDSIRIRITDNGVGIAARQAQSVSVYSGDIEEEIRLVRDAFVSRSSSKLAAQDCRVRGTSGYGFTYILSYLGSLGASATLTTGRLRFEFDHGRGGFELTEGNGFTPGTTLDAIVPICHHQNEESITR